MKMKSLTVGLLLASLMISGVVSAQQRKKTTRKTTTPPAQSSGYGSSGYGTTPTQQQPTQQTSSYGNNNQQQPTNQPQANIPIVVVKSTGNAALDTIKPSLRNDASIERNLIKDRQPLAYENIREDDAVYRQRVWREIDTREKMNLPFRYSADEDNGNQRFISIILKAIRDREITAFDPLDDRFTTPLTPQAVMESFSGGVDTVPVYDLQGNIERYEVRTKEVDPDSIYQFRVKEEWVFDKESSRMFVRILGICPVKPIYTSTGQFIDMSPLFWIYYPDARGVLSRFEAFNGKNFGARMTWEELFENRMFSSYITKTTMDNPYDRRLKDFIKDPILRLLEGENIKDKIFNYEQDLWSY
ncbi:type IX secretion system ring subunit PorN/GldN [Lacibacter sediminis]|uniref:Gliding motility protein GldN n=1 Tax=Lacibacter sediminis TaxID=2760713 RepID=A0A7G5XEP4_9BACT|nr:gliding motility protein GldN [Lacibacter sediminis]QNA43947.1 gliding motility protein GldN [Lacibacter sediminis]